MEAVHTESMLEIIRTAWPITVSLGVMIVAVFNLFWTVRDHTKEIKANLEEFRLWKEKTYVTDHEKTEKRLDEIIRNQKISETRMEERFDKMASQTEIKLDKIGDAVQAIRILIAESGANRSRNRDNNARDL